MSLHRFIVKDDAGGIRLDLYLSGAGLELSRNQVQRLIDQDQVRVNGRAPKASTRLRPGDVVEVEIPPPPPTVLEPEPIPLEILYEDDQVVAVNKPAGLVVHPAAGHSRGTLVHGLLFHCRQLATLGGPLRPGIVHRLDKDTSGVLLVAKTDAAYRHLGRQFRDRLVYKEYAALVYGIPSQVEGRVQAPIRRRPGDRKRMGVVSGGRDAVTTWQLVEHFGEVSLLRVVIHTGRTHQIRVHMAYVHHPVVGDRAYGGKRRVRAVTDPRLRARLARVKRHLLHARRLIFTHPKTSAKVTLEAPLPEDMLEVLDFLRGYRALGAD